MKGFLQEYGIIMVVVAVVLGMLAFGKTGYAKSIQDAIIGSADHIVETGENITKPEIHVNSGDMLYIEGKEFIVLEGRENSQALVMTANKIEERAFQSKARADKQHMSTYEGSEIDNYLENEWYNSLSSTMKEAIQLTNIKQDSYMTYDDPDSKQEMGPNGQVYNTISRHVFLPSVDEIGKAVDLKNSSKIKAFLNGTSIWTRTSYLGYDNVAWGLFYDSLRNNAVYYLYDVRPAFVIDLSKVDYTEAGHTDYK